MFTLNALTESQKKIAAALAVFLLMLAMFLVMFFYSRGAFGAPGDSGTGGEIAHIPSGYTYDKYGDFRLNPEHPPLAKAIAGLPLAFMDINGPEADWSWNGINQWEAGWYMLYEAGNDPAKILFWSRLPMMLLVLVLGVFLYKWTRERYGRKVGLVTLALFAFYPDIIAHGRLVTTDIAAALGYLVTLYYFDRALSRPSQKNTLLASVAFGLAQLLKFSSFLLFGVLLILVLVRALLDRDEGLAKKIWQYGKIYFWTSLLSIILVWLVYIPFVRHTPVSIEHEVIERNLTADPKTLPLRNFLHAFEGNAITRGLGHYLLGAMLVVGRVEGGNATFLVGQVAEKSIRLFFPAAWVIKTPLPIIILALVSIAALIIRRFRSKKEAWSMWVILVPLIVYWAFTIKGSLNIGIRHLIPMVPFILILIAWLTSYAMKVRWQLAGIGLLVAFQIYHTLSYYPNFIGYFNNFVPKEKRYQYLVDSSLDWGQDLLRLKKYVDENKISEIKVDYFGGSVPSYYIPQSRAWHSSYGPTTGWLAVSATFFQSSKLYGPKEGKWSYSWLESYEPKAIIGGSILVYNITETDLLNNPAQSPYLIEAIDFPEENVTNSLLPSQKN